MGNMDLQKIAKNKESMKAAVARIQVQQDDCTEDCGYEIVGTGLVCAAYYSDEDDWINCMITYTSVDCSDCLCEILEESEGYTCSFSDKKKMNQKAKLVKPTRNVGACEGGADCGDGWCCYNPDYPVCCPDTDYFTNWCGATADDCPTSLKKLPKMAAGKNALELTVEMVHVVTMQVILSVAQFVMMDPYGVLILLMIVVAMPSAFHQWLPTKRFRSPQNIWVMDVMVQIVEITGVAMKVTTQSAVPLVMMESNGVLMMLMTVPQPTLPLPSPLLPLLLPE